MMMKMKNHSDSLTLLPSVFAYALAASVPSRIGAFAEVYTGEKHRQYSR